jgi:hypothetical protein
MSRGTPDLKRYSSIGVRISKSALELVDHRQHPPPSAPLSWMTCGAAVPQQLPLARAEADSVEAGVGQQAASEVSSSAAETAQQATPRSARIPDEQTPVSGRTSRTSRAASQSSAMAAAMERTCS